MHSCSACSLLIAPSQCQKGASRTSGAGRVPPGHHRMCGPGKDQAPGTARQSTAPHTAPGSAPDARCASSLDDIHFRSRGAFAIWEGLSRGRALYNSVHRSCGRDFCVFKQPLNFVIAVTYKVSLYKRVSRVFGQYLSQTERCCVPDLLSMKNSPLFVKLIPRINGRICSAVGLSIVPP